jgi:hypothetical protein
VDALLRFAELRFPARSEGRLRRSGPLQRGGEACGARADDRYVIRCVSVILRHLLDSAKEKFAADAALFNFFQDFLYTSAMMRSTSGPQNPP